MSGEDRAAAFLDHLLHNEREREPFIEEVLHEIVEIGKREGYEFTPEDFAKAVKKFIIRCLNVWWPPGHGGH